MSLRKLSFMLIAVAALVAGCSRFEAYDLTDWQVEYNDAWLPAAVPGCIHTDLMAAGIIPDPFYGTNEDSVQWVSDSVWRYRTTIAHDMLEGFEHCELVLQGATLCEVYLNGTSDGEPFHLLALRADNMFRTYRVCIYDALLDGDILPIIDDSLVLEVTFFPIESVNSELYDGNGANASDSQPAGSRPNYQLPIINYQLPDPRAVTRMAPYMLGWDWGPKLSTVGITQSARLECYNGDRPEPKADKPQSWNVELRQEADSIGQSFTFYKDGKPFFAKGANWIPCHSFPILTPALKEQYRYLLSSAKEANINMLRVWGGGIYEPDFFYDLCDSLGIMVWQDFNFSCALYPSDSAFLENVRLEAEEQVRRIARHPCVALWCGNNEVKNGWEDWGWQQQYKWTPEQIAYLQHGIDTLFGPDGILAHAVRDCDPLQRAYVPSSPLYGWGHPECVTHGDSHYWGVWWGEEPFEMYSEKTGRFMSEFGFQSYPDYSTVCRFCPEEQRNIDSPTMRNHQKHGRGREIIDKAMMQYYGVDSRSLSLEDYCYVSQLLQAWGVGYGIYQHLAQQPRCMGTLFWQLDDCWPVASWSSIDCYGNWKALHYRVRTLFDPQADLRLIGEYYKTLPKDLRLGKPQYSLDQRLDNEGRLSATITAKNMLRDVMLQTEPHVDGHFDINYFDLGGGQLTATFIPRDPKADLSHVKVTLRCLNDILHCRSK